MEKKRCITFLFMLFSTTMFAQVSTVDSLRDLLRKRELSHYKCNDAVMTEAKALDSFIFKTFDKVVIGNDEVIKNGTALNLSVTDKTKLSGNYLFKPRPNIGISIGLNATVSNNETMLVNNEGYFQSGWGITGKLSILPFGSGGRFMPDDCKKLTEARRKFLVKEIEDYQRILTLNLSTLEKDIKNNADSVYSDSIKLAREILVDSLAFYIMSSQRAKRLDSLKQIKQEYVRNVKFYAQQLYDSTFKPKIIKFEASTASWSGYTIFWTDIDFSLNTSGKTTIYNDATVNTAKISKNEMFWKYRTGLSYNFATSRMYHAVYASLSLGVQNAYALEGKVPIDTFNYGNLKVVNEGKSSTVYDISQLPNYKDQKWIFSPSILVNWFLGEKKMFGFETFYEMLFRNNLPGVEDSKRKVMNARFGVIVNFSEKFKTSLPTIGVFLKADEYDYKDTFKDYVTIGLRVGVPFDRIFNKKS